MAYKTLSKQSNPRSQSAAGMGDQSNLSRNLYSRTALNSTGTAKSRGTRWMQSMKDYNNSEGLGS